MNDERWSSATLRVSSKTQSVESITALLKVQPSRSISKGSHLSWSNPNSAIADEHRWFLDSDLADSEPLEAHIEKLLSFIEQNISSLERLVSSCDVEIRCGFSSGNSQGGVCIDAALLKRLSAFPLDLVIDLYPPEEQVATRQ